MSDRFIFFGNFIWNSPKFTRSTFFGSLIFSSFTSLDKVIRLKKFFSKITGLSELALNTKHFFC